MDPVTLPDFNRPPDMGDLPPPRPHRSVADDLGTGASPAELFAILAARFRTVREDRAALTLEKHSGRWIYSFLEHLVWRVDPTPDLDRVKLVGVDPDRMVHLMHLLFSV